MTDENDLVGALPLEDRLRIAAVDLAITGAPRALVEAVWRAIERMERSCKLGLDDLDTESYAIRTPAHPR